MPLYAHGRCAPRALQLLLPRGGRALLHARGRLTCRPSKQFGGSELLFRLRKYFSFVFFFVLKSSGRNSVFQSETVLFNQPVPHPDLIRRFAVLFQN